MTSPPIAPRAAVRADVRRALVPVISYPAELPVSQVKDEIAAAIRDHQVLIVAGETGSGKTTQLPKICLELGRGVTGQIGHTQPRRIAARSVAERIAAELGTELGTAVGYQVRFTDKSSDGTLIKVMTDGILLTEMQRDRQLRRYDTLIIDEAHERSLNIDFILGYLKRLLPRRPDLKVIITSATIDPQRFSAAFDGAPVLEVSGRTYPVGVRYRPLADPDDPGREPKDQVQGILDAVAELKAEGPGDILVFLSGEREIRDTADALAGQEDLDVLPLYARLSAAEQHRVFEPHRFSQSRAGRRVVLATNVAETSLTVPGIHYVIDPGTARISRYSHRTKVQRLPIERISQASARQRAGRCGRTADGVCIRLYTEEDFAARPAFTDPEILRTNLASVILQMAALDLGEMADFPFVDPPDSRNIADGVRLLEELGAFAPGSARKLTGLGKKLARLPADPRLGRMILAAGQHGCAREVLIIAAALSIIDPRERPTETRQAADEMHARFAVPGSDFLAFLALWDYLRDRQRELSASAFRRMCRREYLHYLRVREWQDVYGQLRQAAAEVGVVIGRDRREPRAAGPAEPADRFPAELADRVHMSLLAGLLSHIGMQDSKAAPRGQRRGPAEFAGARGARFAIFPDSVLARKPPSWVVAAELVETSRLWARVTARIDPAWAEPLAEHLVKRSYSEPRWDASRGAVLATEKVSLYGLPIVPARTVNYARIDPAAARELFIARALVDGDWETQHRFFARNQQVLDEAASLEQKARRRGIVAEDTVLFDFYDRRIPGSVTSARHFDSWWKKARASSPHLLDLTLADLVRPAAGDIGAADYPERWGDLPLSYEFAPGAPDDGVTVDIPLARLNQVDGTEFGWQVPGLREEMVTELIRTLPKPLRTRFVPVPDTARAMLPQLGAPHGDLLDRSVPNSAAWAGACAAVGVRRVAAARSPADHVPGGRGRPGARVRQGSGRAARPAPAPAAGHAQRGGPRADPDRAARLGPGRAAPGLRTRPGPRVPGPGRCRGRGGHPAVRDRGRGGRGHARRHPAAAADRGAVRGAGGGQPAAGQRQTGHEQAPVPQHRRAARRLRGGRRGPDHPGRGRPAWDAAGFARLLEVARERLAAVTADVVSQVARVLAEAHAAEASLAATPAPALAAAFGDMRRQLAALVHPGFVTRTGARRLADLVRYLQAISRRLDKLPEVPARDAERMAAVHRVADDYASVLAGLPPARRRSPDAQAVRWMIEEFRVSLFAQTLGTRGSVSEQRIERALDQLGQAPAAGQAGR